MLGGSHQSLNASLYLEILVQFVNSIAFQGLSLSKTFRFHTNSQPVSYSIVPLSITIDRYVYWIEEAI